MTQIRVFSSKGQTVLILFLCAISTVKAWSKRETLGFGPFNNFNRERGPHYVAIYPHSQVPHSNYFEEATYSSPYHGGISPSLSAGIDELRRTHRTDNTAPVEQLMTWNDGESEAVNNYPSYHHVSWNRNSYGNRPVNSNSNFARNSHYASPRKPYGGLPKQSYYQVASKKQNRGSSRQSYNLDSPRKPYYDLPKKSFKRSSTNSYGSSFGNDENTFDSSSFYGSPLRPFESLPSKSFDGSAATPIESYPENPLDSYPDNLFGTYSENTFRRTPGNSFDSLPALPFPQGRSPENSLEGWPSNSFGIPHSSLENLPGNSFQNSPRTPFGNSPRNPFETLPGNSFENSRGNQFETLPGNSFENARGNQFENSRGNQFENSRGNQFENSRGNQFENSRGNQFEPSRGNPFQNSRGNPFQNSRGNPFGNVPESFNGNERRDVYESLEGGNMGSTPYDSESLPSRRHNTPPNVMPRQQTRYDNSRATLRASYRPNGYGNEEFGESSIKQQPDFEQNDSKNGNEFYTIGAEANDRQGDQDGASNPTEIVEPIMSRDGGTLGKKGFSIKAGDATKDGDIASAVEEEIVLGNLSGNKGVKPPSWNQQEDTDMSDNYGGNQMGNGKAQPMEDMQVPGQLGTLVKTYFSEADENSQMTQSESQLPIGMNQINRDRRLQHTVANNDRPYPMSRPVDLGGTPSIPPAYDYRPQQPVYNENNEYDPSMVYNRMQEQVDAPSFATPAPFQNERPVPNVLSKHELRKALKKLRKEQRMRKMMLQQRQQQPPVMVEDDPNSNNNSNKFEDDHEISGNVVSQTRPPVDAATLSSDTTGTPTPPTNYLNNSTTDENITITTPSTASDKNTGTDTDTTKQSDISQVTEFQTDVNDTEMEEDVEYDEVDTESVTSPITTNNPVTKEKDKKV